MSSSAPPDSTPPGRRDEFLPYGHQCIEEADIEAVVACLRSEWLTTGPRVEEFERAFATFCGVEHAVAVSSGTAALHAAMAALAVGPGDEVIVAALTFAASANCIVFQGATPVFADVQPGSLLLDPAAAERLVTPRTRAVVAVDYAGQPCDYAALRALCQRNGLAMVADACHALGAGFGGEPVGSLADISTFSFHPVKPLTTGEGGMATTSDPEVARRMRTFRNHGITTDHRQRQQAGAWFYEMTALGYNYRLPDLNCALGLTQLGRVEKWTRKRQELAAHYDNLLAGNALATPLERLGGRTHAFHLYVVQLAPNLNRGQVFSAMRARNIGVNVHYIPVHLHPFYRERFGTGPGLCPVAEAAYERILSLPIFPAMTLADAEDVVAALRAAIREQA